MLKLRFFISIDFFLDMVFKTNCLSFLLIINYNGMSGFSGDNRNLFQTKSYTAEHLRSQTWTAADIGAYRLNICVLKSAQLLAGRELSKLIATIYIFIANK